MKKLLPILSLILLTGCANYSHVRKTPDGKIIERTGFTAFMMWGNAGKIASKTTESTNTYSRTMSVGTVQAGVDSNAIEAITKGAVNGAIEAAKNLK